MLKLFYRLKRRGGVVLFAVIAIMTLLITMASVAYFTARSSYTTVIQNYDASQLYLSATSVADMLLDALTETTTMSGKGASSNNYDLNVFENLQSQLRTMRDKTTKNSIKGVSYVDSLGSGNAATNDSVQSIIDKTKDNPIAPGILDALKVDITFDPADTKPVSGSSGMFDFYFTLTTTAMYRENSVTVQDVVINRAQKTTGTTTVAAPGYSSFLTSTGQKLDGSNMKKEGRAVIMDMNEISDDAHYEGKYTIFTGIAGANNPNNVFKGGVTSSGTLVLNDKTSTNIPPVGKRWKADILVDDPNARHDWIIGGDLVILDDRVETLDLKDNNLYVNGDLILGNQKTIKAANVYVTGNIIITKETGTDKFDVTGGVYCGGNVICQENFSAAMLSDPARKYSDEDEPVNIRNKNIKTVQDLINDINNSIAASIASAGRNIATITETGGQVNSGGFGMTGKLVVGGDVIDKYGNVDSGYKAGINYDKTANYTPASYSVQVAEYTKNETTDVNDKRGYVYTLRDKTVEEVMNPKTGDVKTSDYYAYTAKAETMAHTLKFDLSAGVDIIDTNGASTSNSSTTSVTTPLGSNSDGEPVVLEKITKVETKKTTNYQKGDDGVKIIGVYTETSTRTTEYYKLYIYHQYWTEEKNTEWGGSFTYNGTEYKKTEGAWITTSDAGSVAGAVQFTYTASNELIIEHYATNADGTLAKDANNQPILEYKDQVIENGKETKRTYADGSSTTIKKDGDTYTVKVTPEWDTTIEATAVYYENVANANKNPTVTLPYYKDGYILDFNPVSPIGNIAAGNTKERAMNVLIETEKDKTMPIVLKANFKDDSGKQVDSDGNNAFAWKAGDYANDNWVNVQLVDKDNHSLSAQGNVFMEVGNWDSTTGDYVSYDLASYDNNPSKITTATYYVDENLRMGTKNQVQAIVADHRPGEENDRDIIYGMYQAKSDAYPTGNDPKDEYDDRLMLVSNENGGIGVNQFEEHNLMFAYVYAPNATWENYTNGSKLSIFGGLIASDYVDAFGDITYAEPNPAILESLFGAAKPPSVPTSTAEATTDGIFKRVEETKYYLG